MDARSTNLSTINHPLGFFVLALLIVESSLAVVLIWSDLDQSQKFMGMWALVGLFLFLIVVVTFLVCKYPKNLTYQAEDHLKERTFGEINLPSREVNSVKSREIRTSSRNIVKFALVEYKVDSVLPGTVYFDLVKDEKVWFWIANLQEKKYLAYIKIRFKVGDYIKDVKEGYYGGKKPWNLNSFMGIRAPGMPVSDEKIISRIKTGEKLEVTINCEVKDENNKLVEKKLPVTYGYDPENKSWYLIP